MQLSNGHDSDQGGNGWTSVLNITFENWHVSVYIGLVVNTCLSYFNTEELRAHIRHGQLYFFNGGRKVFPFLFQMFFLSFIQRQVV